LKLEDGILRGQKEGKKNKNLKTVIPLFSMNFWGEVLLIIRRVKKKSLDRTS